MTARPLDILLVMEATDGGTGRHLRDLGSELTVAGHRVHIVCAMKRNPAFRKTLDNLVAAGVQVTEVPMSRDIEPLGDIVAVLRLARVFRRYPGHLIHLHSSRATALGRIAALLAGRPRVIVTPHAFAFLDTRSLLRSRFYLLVEKILALRNDFMVAVSESEREIACAHRLSSASRITVVQNGVDLPEPARSEEPAEPGGSVAPLRIGCLGRLEPQKDPLKIIEIAGNLAARGVPFEIRVAGTGAMAEKVRRYCDGARLGGRIKLLGHIADTGMFYDSLDAFLITSRYEGLPYAVLDAMAHGLPVVGFDVPGVRDVVSHGRTGLLALPGDVGALAAHLERLGCDPRERRSMGREGRHCVSQHFSLGRQIRDLESFYRWVADRLTESVALDRYRPKRAEDLRDGMGFSTSR